MRSASRSLTAAVNELPYVPGQAGKLGIFEESGIPTTTSSSSATRAWSTSSRTRRAAPRRKPRGTNRRELRTFTVPHLPTRASIGADSLRNVRAFGSNQLQSLEEVRNQHMMNHMASLDATVEYQRIGAIKGNILRLRRLDGDLRSVHRVRLTQDTPTFALGTTTTDVSASAPPSCATWTTPLAAPATPGRRVLRRLVLRRAAQPCERQGSSTPTGGGLAASPATTRASAASRSARSCGINYRGSIGGVSFIPDTKEAMRSRSACPACSRPCSPGGLSRGDRHLGLPRYAKAELTELRQGHRDRDADQPAVLLRPPAGAAEDDDRRKRITRKQRYR
jgi:hypothetical protein